MSSPTPTSRFASSDNGLKLPTSTSSGLLGIAKSSHSYPHSQSGLQTHSLSQRDLARSSVDASRSGPSLTAGMGTFLGQSSSPGPTPSHSRGARPASEFLSGGALGSASPESEAMDRWFTDLQHYETTLEEMAAASLDQAFKEELTAIEQWFRVLSEPERTAALYSLLQSSTQMQIRFFITVLQQMARADPVGAALLSPTHQGSMENQMEQRLAQLNFKSGSPSRGAQARASLGVEATNFLSPNAALLDPNDTASAALSQQRAKLRSAAHRISAPGTLLSGGDGMRSPVWNTSESVAERSTRSPSPAASETRSRPKSTGSDMSAGHATNSLLRNSILSDEAGLSPMPAGSWASLVNTPAVPMFQRAGGTDEDGTFGNALQSPSEMSPSRLGWGTASAQAAAQSGIVLDDARKFRRTGRVPSSSGLMGPMGSIGSSLPPSSVAPGSSPTGGVAFDASGNFVMPSGVTQQAPRRVVSGPASASRTATSPTLATSMLASQQAALAAQQNWRAAANGLLNSHSGSVGPNAAPFGTTSQGAMPAAYASAAAAVSTMTPQDVATYNMANLLMQQQQQLQLQQNLMNLGMGGNLGLPSNLGAMSPSQMAVAMGNPVMLGGATGSPAARRSPRSSDRGLNKPGPIPGSGANPEEQVDDALLKDVSAWLRSLRLHKYTTNFEGTKWQDMVQMDDSALEAKGVSALGARRKLLKVFEVVRQQKGIAPPAGVTSLAEPLRALSPGASSAADSSIAED